MQGGHASTRTDVRTDSRDVEVVVHKLLHRLAVLMVVVVKDPLKLFDVKRTRPRQSRLFYPEMAGYHPKAPSCVVHFSTVSQVVNFRRSAWCHTDGYSVTSVERLLHRVGIIASASCPVSCRVG